jgi:hydroxymethylglutaryl-CoA lyase
MADLILHDVGLRDGLQIERTVVPTATRIAWAKQLAASGLDMIQLGSFVHREKVPQMADTDEVFAAFREAPAPPVLSGLVLNEKGLERGLTCGVKYFCMGVSASETHSRKNTGMTIAEAQQRIIATGLAARAAGAAVQMSVQSAFGCGYEGEVAEARVLDIVERFVGAGFPVVSLADTAGHATPDRVERLFTLVRALDGAVECACHFHDTYGLGLVNCHAAMRAGVKYFEAAFAGMGGCPFTAVSGGNVCTEDLLHMWHRMGLRTDVALGPIISVATLAAQFFGRDLPGRVHTAGPMPLAAPASA